MNSEFPHFTRYSDSSQSPDFYSQTFLPNDFICFSHLRWDFVHQRPHHLMERLAKLANVYYFEEPLIEASATKNYLRMTRRSHGLTVVQPIFPKVLEPREETAQLRVLLNSLISSENMIDVGFWYYTPMALLFSDHLETPLCVYDCMDELSKFKGAPAQLPELEARLFKKADVVFTGGQTLYESKESYHSNIYAFPSSIDFKHFAKARKHSEDPEDQRSILHPRLGFYGVIDERMDLSLLEQVADLRPDWHIVMIGPVVKIDPEQLPKRENIHYLGGKSYQELPSYLSHWDVAIMPFAKNDSTRFISPTKTPEFLAAGRPVVSTSIRDVVRPYGKLGLVKIADTALAFVRAVEAASLLKEDANFFKKVDQFLAGNSWDKTFEKMAALMTACLVAEGVEHDDRESGAGT